MKQTLQTTGAEGSSSTATIESTNQEGRFSSLITRRLFRGASIYVAALALGKGLTVVLQAVLGRWLGPSRYGLYGLGYSVVSLVSWIAVLGLDQGVLRYCALYRSKNQPAKVRANLWRALILASTVSVITTLALVLGSGWIASRFFVPSLGRALALFAIALPFLTVIRIAGTYLQSLHKIAQMSVVQLLARPAVNLALVGATMALGWGLEGAVGAFLFCTIATAGLGIYYLMRNLPPAGGEMDHVGGEGTPLVRYSLALMLSGISYQVILRAAPVLLGHLSTPAQVGIYSAGASFALGFGFLSSTFLQPAMPMMVDLYESGQTEELRRLYRNTTRWTLALVTPILLGFALFSEQIMKFFGRGFEGGAPVLLILSLAWLAYFGKGPGSALLQMAGRQKLDLANTAGAAVIALVLNFLAIPRFGAQGAALATAIGIFAWALAEYLEVRLLYGIAPWSLGARINILGAAVTAATGILMRLSLNNETLGRVTVCIYLPFYLGSLLSEPDDRQVARAVLARFSSRVR